VFVPGVLILCDYLLYYPLIDMDSTDMQTFDNTVTLPRYTTGEGVQAFLVATNPYIGGAGFELRYTNVDGVPNRITTPILSNTVTTIGTLVHSASAATLRTGPFIQINPCDRGIKSVQSIQFNASNGGLATLVLCKPLATIPMAEVTATVEQDFFLDKPSAPRIYDGAYLNFLCLPNGSVAAAQLIGDMTVVWG
jgi:hypothetical protein